MSGSGTKHLVKPKQVTGLLFAISDLDWLTLLMEIFGLLNMINNIFKRWRKVCGFNATKQRFGFN